MAMRRRPGRRARSARASPTERMAPHRKFSSSTDVARLAGVSQSQVSRTFRADGSVSEKTRAKVLAAAAALDYRPSVIPRIMLTQRSGLVAIAVGGMTNPFNAAALERLTAGLQAEGWQALLVHVDSGHSLDGAIPKLAGYRVDAVISALAVLSREAADALARNRIPVVSFNTVEVNAWVSSVSSDNAAAGRSVAELFLARGARHLGFVPGPPDSPAGLARWAGFRDSVLAAGLPEPAVLAGGDFTYEAGRRAVLAARRAGALPEALFGANDLIALGAIDGLRQDLGLDVPGDVMVAGFDDIPPSAWEGYDLTTAAQNIPAMVEAALAILGAATASPARDHAARVVVPARLVERGSTRPRR